MTDQTTTLTSGSRKRSHDEAEGLSLPNAPAEKAGESHLATPQSPPAIQMSRALSGQPSSPATVESSPLSDVKSVASLASQVTPQAVTDAAPAKKLKQTFTERAIEKMLTGSTKEALDKKRADEAQRKEHEKLAKVQDKQRKEDAKKAVRAERELERAEKQKAKDAEKQSREEAKRKREEEKKAKEEEKTKKERTQLRLGSFFPVPATEDALRIEARTFSRSPSITSTGGNNAVAEEVPIRTSPQKKPEAKIKFLPFFVGKHIAIAPVNRFSRDENNSHIVAARLDQEMGQDFRVETTELKFAFKSAKRKRYQNPACTIKQMIENIQGTSASPIDLTAVATTCDLSSVPYKILSFREDVRPPYTGTYTRLVSPQSALHLSRNPFSRQLPNTNYDYDSEAEWEPPKEDDEDIESGGDDMSDVGEEGDEDMDGFLDDGDDDLGRRKQIVEDLAPISSGLCWAQMNGEAAGPLENYRMQPLSDEHAFPIDPFSSAYWPQALPLSKQQQQAMQPPRLPLSSLNPNRSPSMTPPLLKGDYDLQPGEAVFQVPPPTTTTQGVAGAITNARVAAKTLTLAPTDVLPAFKQAVRGSHLTKTGLIEVLKKKFPKLPKDTIKHTLGHVAVRQGVKEADKVWVLKD